MSANIIDEMFVSLGLDNKAFQKGAKQTSADVDKVRKDSEKAAKEIEAAGKRAANFFGEVRNQALALAAVFLGGMGIKDFAQSVSDAGAASGRLASNLGISTDELTEWEGAAKRAGGSADGMDTSLKTISSALQKFDLTGEMDGPLALFYQLGIRFQDAHGKALPLKTIMMEISDVLAKQTPQRATEISKMLGFDEGTGNLLRMGSAEVEKLMQHVRDLGVVTREQAAASIELKNDFADLDQIGGTLGRTFLTKVEPALHKTLTTLIDLGKWFQAHPNIANGVIGSVTALGAVLTALTGLASFKLLGRFLGIGGKAAAAEGGAAAVAEGGAAAVAEGGAAVAARGILARLALNPYVAGLLALFHTDNLNEGEDAAMARHRADSAAAAAASSGGGASGDTSGMSRGMRNNNPGNIEYGDFARAHGATGVEAQGRFAKFATLADGQAAQRALLESYVARGYDTISKVVNRYAPSSDNNNTAAYVAALVKRTGIGADAQLTSDQIGSLSQAIQIQENGAKYASAIMGGIGSNGARASASAGGTSTSEVNIQTINVHTAATDADGMARDMKQAVTSHGLVAQANTGPQ